MEVTCFQGNFKNCVKLKLDKDLGLLFLLFFVYL